MPLSLVRYRHVQLRSSSCELAVATRAARVLAAFRRMTEVRADCALHNIYCGINLAVSPTPRVPFLGEKKDCQWLPLWA